MNDHKDKLSANAKGKQIDKEKCKGIKHEKLFADLREAIDYDDDNYLDIDLFIRSLAKTYLNKKLQENDAGINFFCDLFTLEIYFMLHDEKTKNKEITLLKVYINIMKYFEDPNSLYAKKSLIMDEKKCTHYFILFITI